MRIRDISRWLYFVIAILSILSVAATALALSQFSQRKKTHESLSATVAAISDIRRTSDALTISAQGYASTGSPEYLRNYTRELKNDRTRSYALIELRKLDMTADEQELIARVTMLSRRLGEIEAQVFDKAEGFRDESYRQLIFGDSYQKTKAALSQSLDAAQDSVASRLAGQSEKLTWRGETADSVGAILTLALSIAALGAVGGFFMPKVVGPVIRLRRATDNLLRDSTPVHLVRAEDPPEIQALSRSLERYQNLINVLRQQHWIEKVVARINLALSQCETQMEFAEVLLREIGSSIDPVFMGFHWRADEQSSFRSLLTCGQSEFEDGYFVPSVLVERAEREGPLLRLSRPISDSEECQVGESAAGYVLAVKNSGVTVALLQIETKSGSDPRMYSYLRALVDLVSARHEVLSKTLKAAMLLSQTRAQAAVLEESRRTLLAQTSELGQLNSSLSHKTMRLEDMTARLEERQGELATVKEWLHTVIESAPDGMVVAETGGRVILANKKFADIFSCPHSELVGTTLETLTPAEFQRVIAPAIDPAKRAIEWDDAPMALLECELALGGPANTRRHFLEVTWSRLPQQSNDGEAVCINIRDVTAREQLKLDVAQAQLEADRRKRLIASISEALPLAVFQAKGSRDDFQIEFVSEQIEALVGVSSSDLMSNASSRFRNLDLPEEGGCDACLPEITQSILAGGQLAPHTRMCLIKHGERVRWIRIHSVPTLSADGQEVLWHGYCEDITERDRARRLLQAILDESPSGVFVKDLNGKYLLTNHAFDRFFDTPQGAAIGRDDFLFLEGADAEAVRAIDRAVIESRSPLQRESSLSTASGVKNFLTTKFPLLDHDGEPYAIGGIAQDISGMLEEREKVRVAMRLAEDASRVKSDFLANMSHEIRTPLNAVIGLSHLALRTPLDAQQRDYLRKISAAGSHLLGIVNDVLDISRIEAGKLEIEALAFSPRLVIEGALDLVRERASSKGIELICNIASEIPERVVGDALRTGQVLTNFLSNAVKFTQTGEVALTLNGRQANDVWLLDFSVTDTGIGISPAQIERLFEVFEQGDASTTRRFGGTGLGLAIAKRLALAMHGEVGATSTPGQGSTFWFRAPYKRVAGAETSRPSALQSPNETRVLLVEPHQHVCDSMLRLLAEIGLTEVVSVNAPAEALRRLSDFDSRDISLGLIDIDCLGVDEQDFFVQAEACSAGRSLAWIAFASGGAGAARLVSTRYSNIRVLSKPIGRDLLLTEIKSALSGALTLPRAVDLEPDDGALHAQLAGRSVLVVDDDPVNVQVAVELLQVAGCCVHQASSGAEAIELVRRNAYEVILLDMQMPEMDGIETCRAIRALPCGADLHIIAMTANVLAQDRERYLAAGLNAHLGKPVTPQALWAAVARAVTHRVDSTSERGAAHVGGLDTEAGLRCVAGNWVAYRRILLLFSEHYGDSVERARLALKAWDLEQLARVSHTLRGASANIGATTLSARWAELEQHALQGREATEMERLLGVIEPLFALCMAEIERAGSGEEQANPGAGVADVDVLRLCQELTDLARDGRADALDLLEVSEGQLARAFPVETAALCAAARRFDWSEMLSQLQRIAALGAKHG